MLPNCYEITFVSNGQIGETALVMISGGQRPLIRQRTLGELMLIFLVYKVAMQFSSINVSARANKTLISCIRMHRCPSLAGVTETGKQIAMISQIIKLDWKFRNGKRVRVGSTVNNID